MKFHRLYEVLFLYLSHVQRTPLAYTCLKMVCYTRFSDLLRPVEPVSTGGGMKDYGRVPSSLNFADSSHSQVVTCDFVLSEDGDKYAVFL